MNRKILQFLRVVGLCFFMLAPSVYALPHLLQAQHNNLQVDIPQGWEITEQNGTYVIQPQNNDQDGPEIILLFRENTSGVDLKEAAEKMEVGIAQIANFTPSLYKIENLDNGGVVRISNFTLRGKNGRMAIYVALKSIMGKSYYAVGIYNAEVNTYHNLGGKAFLLRVSNSARFIQANLPQEQNNSHINKENQNTGGMAIPRFDIPLSCTNGLDPFRARGRGSVFETRSDCIQGEQVSYNNLKNLWPQVTSPIRKWCIEKEANWRSYRSLIFCVNDRMKEPTWKW